MKLVQNRLITFNSHCNHDCYSLAGYNIVKDRYFLQEPIFTTDKNNVLTELSELRLEIEKANQDFELKCRLRFGKMRYAYGSRSYEVGVSRAFLRLTLEGCESKINNVFGEDALDPMEEKKSVETAASFEASASVAIDAKITGKAGMNIGNSGALTRKRSQNTLHLPVSARPNDSWEIKPQSIHNQKNKVLEGTAIPNTRLCSITRKHGGNRIAVIGELQVSKSDLKVSAEGGNKVGRAMSKWQNKDAIISQILKTAIQREVTTVASGREKSIVTISRCDVLES